MYVLDCRVWDIHVTKERVLKRFYDFLGNDFNDVVCRLAFHIGNVRHDIIAQILGLSSPSAGNWDNKTQVIGTRTLIWLMDRCLTKAIKIVS